MRCAIAYSPGHVSSNKICAMWNLWKLKTESLPLFSVCVGIWCGIWNWKKNEESALSISRSRSLDFEPINGVRTILQKCCWEFLFGENTVLVTKFVYWASLVCSSISNSILFKQFTVPWSDLVAYNGKS